MRSIERQGYLLETGAVLPEAVVPIRNLETGSERKLISDSARRYAVPSDRIRSALPGRVSGRR